MGVKAMGTAEKARNLCARSSAWQHPIVTLRILEAYVSTNESNHA